MLPLNSRQPSLILPIMSFDPFPDAVPVLRSHGKIIPQRANKLLVEDVRRRVGDEQRTTYVACRVFSDGLGLRLGVARVTWG